MEESTGIKKFAWGKVFAAAVTVLGLVGSIVGIATGMIPFVQGRHPIKGTWTLQTQTEKTTETRFRGMELVYRDTSWERSWQGGHSRHTRERLIPLLTSMEP